jgi:CubicO group peptidase (beta-lactamase class C family)
LITIRHLLAHRGKPNSGIRGDGPERSHPAQIEILRACAARSRAAAPVPRQSGGFIMAEVVRRASGESIATWLEREICEPLGFRWMRYGVRPDELDLVARDAVTGPPVPPPLSMILRRALGASIGEVVKLAGDPRFLTGLVPAANVVSNAWELCAFFECPREGLDGARV